MKKNKQQSMYIFEFPNGFRLRSGKLDWITLQSLKDQTDRDIEKIITIGNNENIEYYLDEDRTRSGLLVSRFMDRPPPFLSEDGNAPSPGLYKVILKENLEDIIDRDLCGTLIDWTLSDNSLQNCREFFGKKLQYFIKSCNDAEFRYCIAVISDKLIITLDYSMHVDKFLSEVLQPINIIDINSPNSSGAICGQIYSFAQILPFSMLHDITVAHPAITTILFTGLSFSGSVAHAAAIIFRDYLKHTSHSPTIKCVSFSGPLCGSPTLHNYITTSGQLENHVTVNSHGVILDRLLADYQRLSSLASYNFSSWNSILDCFHRALQSTLSGKQLSPDAINQLSLCETNLSRHPRLTQEGNLMPIGRYVFRSLNEEITLTLNDIYPYLCTLKRFHSIEYASYSLHSLQSGIGTASFSVDFARFQPKITEVSIIMTQRRMTINFVGNRLDTILSRLQDNEITLTQEFIDRLPLRVKFQTGRFEFLSNSRLLSIRSFPTRAIIDMSGVLLHGSGLICLRTDFGETNELPFNEETMVKGEDATPSKSLHPTMNAEFLSAAFLRCVICKAHFNENIDPSVTELWRRLLELENEIFEIPSKSLATCYDQYFRGEIDIGIVRNTCLFVFEEMSRQATSSIEYQEYPAFRGLRKLSGALLRATAGLITFTGVLLSVPAVILAIPMISVLREAFAHSDRSRIGIMSGSYLGVVGLIGLPTIIMMSLGYFLSSAGAYAMSDYPTHKYKEVLQMMIDVMGGNALEVVDEVPQLEDCILLRSRIVFPELVLTDCSLADIDLALERAHEKSDAADSIKSKFAQQPLLRQKLQLVGRICAIRQLLQHTLMIGFVGVHNAGKSTTISGLFEVDTGADLIVRTEKPVPYHVGDWVDAAARVRPELSDWLNEKSRNTMRLYAVDFPGTTDEREAIATMTYYTAELASMFVVILKAGHIAGPEREVVDVVKSKHKPFMVVINHCDSIAHELKKPGSIDRFRTHYADILKVDPFQVHFMCALDSSSTDSLRGILFGQIQTLIGDSEIVRALALRMIPPSVALQLKEEIFQLPQQFASASYTLLFNLSTVRKETLEATFNLLIRDTIDVQEKTTTMVDFQTLSFASKDLVLQTALALNIPAPLYSLCLTLINRRSIHFKKAFDEVEHATLQSETQKHLEILISTLALSSLRDQLCTTFKKSSVSTANNLMFLVAEVLILSRELYTDSLGAGFDEEVVMLTMMELFTNTDPIDEDSFFMKMLEKKKVLEVAKAHEESSNESTASHEPDSNFTEINRFRLGQTHLEQMRQVLSFQISEITPPRYTYNDSNDIKLCKENITSYCRDHLTNICMLELPSMENVLPELIKLFRSLKEEQLKCLDIRFRIRNDEAIDANGVTRSVFTKAAQELNDNPSQVYFRMDDASRLLYPDPNFCIAGVSSEGRCIPIGEVMTTYRALGRIIGYSLTKSILGVTFPANFPLVIYKILLGMRVNVTDFVTINPGVYRTLEMCCLMSEEDLQNSSFFFTIGLSNRDEYELCPNGKHKSVTPQNRLEYLTEITRFYLCCGRSDSGSPLREFILGVQHSIPREIFSPLSPLAFQIIVEGERIIKVEQWRQYAIINLPKFTESCEIVVDWFWNIVERMSNIDRQKLLIFTTGSATLPSNGFQDLTPQFSLHIDPIMSPDGLPQSRTCLSMLMLPKYHSEKKLEEKLLYAIHETNATTMGRA